MATRGDVVHPAGAPDAEKDLVERIVADARSFEDGTGRDFRDNCNKWYRQYRSFSKWAADWVQGDRRDRDSKLTEAKATWGAHLHIPLSFRTIETLVPAAIAHRPKLLYLPRQEQWQRNVESVRLMIDSQQENIDIDLPLQAVMRSGRIYGLGVGKAYWLKEYSYRRRVERQTFKGKLMSGNVFAPGYKVGERQKSCDFDDPMFEDVDIFDFMWDPYGSHLVRGTGRCRWVAHRIWMSHAAILDRIESGGWVTESIAALRENGNLESYLKSLGGTIKYDDVWRDRMEASGFSTPTMPERGEQPHELIEWHGDGDRVVSILDRSLLVQDAENPGGSEYSFQAYRPTPLQKQFVGIGDLEPLEHLQRELDTLRSQRRDAATLALAAGWIYDSAHVEEEDLVFGPAAAIEVRNAGDVSRVLQRIQAGDVPGSSYQEEQVVRQDFDAIPGMTDALDPSQGGTSSTATQAQLVQASLSRRIDLGARRFELEVVRHIAREFLRLDQRMITEQRDPLRQPDHGMDAEQAAAEGRWRWVEQSPDALQGEFEIIPEGGSMAARNIPQDRQDAQLYFAMARDNPYVDARRPIMKGLELMGVKDPAAWLKQSDPPVPPLALEILTRAGVSPNLIQRAIEVAQRQDPQLNPDQGPNVQQVDQAMAA